MCWSLHLLSNKLLPGTTSLPISYNGILIDTHLKKAALQHPCKGWWQQVRGRAGAEGHVCLYGYFCVCLWDGQGKRSFWWDGQRGKMSERERT